IEDLHHFDAMVAHEYYDLNIDVVGLTKTGFPFGGMYQPDAASTLTDGNGYLEDYRIESYLGRLNYDYDDKYYLSASLRSDASSRFPEDFRWETFWSVGGNYRISKEAFMEDYSDWLDNLAIRASYGIQGNDNLLTTRDGVSVSDFYPWQSLYDLSWANGNESGALVTSIENDKLSWERIATFNTGLDVSLWDSRLQVGLEYFHRKTNDLLLPYPLPLSSGFSSYNRNSGNMLNSGFELLLSGKIIKTQDLEWSATLMGSRIRNKVLKLTDDGEDILSGSYIIREGEPLYSLYVVRSAGVDPLNGDPLYWATVDANGDDVDPYITTSSVLANQSRYVAGSKYPDFYGSISTDLKYKAFDFSIATNYSYGGKMLDGVYNTLMSFGYAAQAKHKNLERAWKKPGDVTDLHRYEINGSYPVTDNQLIDASYFSIKNITLGYTLASKISKKAGIKTLRVYAAADNVAIFTHLKGTNPQYSINSGTDFVYAPTRTFSLGIDLKF
ncbi:MAG: TonB-dependent receptor, partial [Candidatus Symbiothrix sp.]|nr:TonB-dependent receptor [Candidatus Symbiothrix sp.]